MTFATWVSLAQAVGGPAVAGAAVYFTTKQVHIAREKLRLDLYPARYRIYTVVLDAVIVALNESVDSALDAGTVDLRRAVGEARFLFSPDIFKYLGALETTVLQYRVISLALKRDFSSRLTMEDPSRADDAERRARWHGATALFLSHQLQELPRRLAGHLRVDDEVSLADDARVRGGGPPPPQL